MSIIADIKINIMLVDDMVINRLILVKSILVCKFLGYHFVVNHPA